MQKYRKYIIVISSGLAIMMLVILVGIFWSHMPLRTVIMGVAWAMLLLLLFSLGAFCRKAVSDSSKLSNSLYAQMETITQTLIAAESAISQKNETLAANKETIDRITELNNSCKQQIALLRNEASTSKTRLNEARLLVEKLRERAERSDNLKAAFIANINDELRNPLNTIMGYVSLLTSTALSEEKRAEYIETINRDAQRFLYTINDLFYYAKLMSGDIDPKVSTFNINATLHTAVSMARQWVAEQGKHIEIRLQECAGNGFISGFEGGFVTILNNLLSNAVKFTNEGLICVTCHIDGSIIKIVVEDTGIGFSAAKRDVIFGAFNQADPTLSRKYVGTGLGLSICRMLSLLMNGTITAHSHEGVGSRFAVEIPLLPASEPDIDLYERASKMLSSSAKNSSILVITPYNSDFDFINAFFAHYNIPVVRSQTPQESETLINSLADITVAIIDLFSSSLEGIEAAEHIFRLKPGMQFVFISHGSLDPSQHQSVGSYSDIVINKPLSSLQLSSILPLL